MKKYEMEGEIKGSFYRAEEVDLKINQLREFANNSNEMAARLYAENEQLKKEVAGWKQRANELYMQE